MVKETPLETLLTGKDSEGQPYTNHIKAVHKHLFGKTCMTCPSYLPHYINKIKSFDMSEEPRKCKYKFKSNPVITYKKQKFSNANLTEAAAEGWVKEMPSRVAHFDLKSRELLKEFLKPKKKANKKAKEETKIDSSEK